MNTDYSDSTDASLWASKSVKSVFKKINTDLSDYLDASLWACKSAESDQSVFKDNQFIIDQFSIACIAANNSTYNILALASGKANHKTPNWHCRAKYFRANESRAKLVWAMPSAAENHMCVKCMELFR